MRIYEHPIEIYSSPFASSWRHMENSSESCEKSSSLSFTTLCSHRRPVQNNTDDNRIYHELKIIVLTSKYIDWDAIDVITPGHFLIRSDLLENSEPHKNEITLAERLRFQKQIVTSFWNLWSKSCLAQFQNRMKWKPLCPNLCIGDVIILNKPNWLLGIIVDVKPDSKGRLRFITIRAKGSEYQRSILQLVKLPVEDESTFSNSTSNASISK